MSFAFRFFAVVGGVAIAASAAYGTGINLSEAENFNLLTWGGATLLSSDTGGRVAVGGDVIFNGSSVGAQATNPTPLTASLVVGGYLIAGNGEVANGSIYVGGFYFGPGSASNSAPGSVTEFGLGGAVPFDFATAEAALAAKSLAFGGTTSNGTSLLQSSTLTLTGTHADLNVFNITASQLENASTLTINAVAGSQVLVNVSGATATFSNKGIDGAFSAALTLFNFYEAASLSMSGIGIEGSILAPFADVSFYSGQMNGQLIANSFSGAFWGTGELHDVPFEHPVPIDSPPGTPVSDGGTTGLLCFGAVTFLFAARTRGAAARG